MLSIESQNACFILWARLRGTKQSLSYTERECLLSCMKPLIAAEATTFVFVQKVAKNQDKKILPPTGKTPRPALFVGPFPAFNHGSFKSGIK